MGGGRMAMDADARIEQKTGGVRVGANEFAAGRARSPPARTARDGAVREGGSRARVSRFLGRSMAPGRGGCRARSLGMTSSPRDRDSARSLGMTSLPRDRDSARYRSTPMCSMFAVQSAKADFVNFQRRIHSLRLGLRQSGGYGAPESTIPRISLPLSTPSSCASSRRRHPVDSAYLRLDSCRATISLWVVVGECGALWGTMAHAGSGAP
jgi:hypothetical protein